MFVYLQNQDGGVHAGLVHLCIMYFINIGLMFSTLYSEDVIAIDSGVELANTYFVKNVDGKFLWFLLYRCTWIINHLTVTEMYSQLIFCDFINHVDGVQLPAVVLSGEVQKTEFNQLEVRIILC